MNQLITLQAAIDLIKQGKALSLAGNESTLDQLPAGNWIAGTIPYFMVAEGGTVVQDDRLFATELSHLGTVTLASYGPDELAGISGHAPDNGFAVTIIPAASESHRRFAAEAATYKDAFLKPAVGWIAGVHLDDLGKASPKVYDGRTATKHTDRAVVAYVALPADKLVQVDILNLFTPGDGPVIEFERSGFTGGDVTFTAPSTLDPVAWRDAVSRVGLTVQERQLPRGSSNSAKIDMTPEQRAEWCQQVAIKLVEDAIGSKYELRGTESVGPKIGEELMHSGIIAVLVTLGAIAAYVWFRFEWQFGVGALIAMLHDVISTIGLFVLLRLDFSLTALAAVLTIAGYSINDTVVVFDRVRENMRRYKKMPLVDLLNFSVNETLARTLMTSMTVFVAVLALVLFGGPVLYSFSIAMLWGVIVGTYSSIWIACAGLVYMNLRPEQLRAADDEKDSEKAKA